MAQKFILLLLSFITTITFAQTGLNFDSYKLFLEQNKNLTYSHLTTQYDAGYFKSNINNSWDSALYADSVDTKYKLTEDEKTLIKQNGFVVTERLALPTHSAQLLDIFHKDLPVFISTDFILHAVHKSYDDILKTIELNYLIPKFQNLLKSLHDKIPEFANRYTIYKDVEERIKDIDAYITVPLKFFDNSVSPNYKSNDNFVKDMYNYSLDAQFVSTPFFSEIKRPIDFSQFKPRGHYDDPDNTILPKYFRAMIWMGKMELYLIAPNSLNPPLPDDVKRQAVMSALFVELINYADLNEEAAEIENAIKLFVGEQDNVTLANLKDVFAKAELTSSSELLDSAKFDLFQQTLKNQPYADQKILSQVLFVDPFNTDQLNPASSFLLFGQRFVIDSYITGSVVYDKIMFEGNPILRMLPSTLDILFALGNDASAQLLKTELDTYKYAANLSALRYLVNQYEPEFWNSSIYNNWLNTIRTLNPPSDRTSLPQFMQTAAWWQHKMNTQLSSWAELRHDNLLYAKQSYTGGITCSYPYSYVEPNREFFNSVKALALSASEKLKSIKFDNSNLIYYFDNLYSICDTLGSIAQKELDRTQFSGDEINFLQKMISEEQGCGVTYNGWLPKLFYSNFEATLENSDYLTADYHTSPTDEFGNLVGWVKHAGTGPVDLIILNATLPDGKNVAFVGSVSSYHEYTTTNFERLTDSEWKEVYLTQSSRPDWVNLYLANDNGEIMPQNTSLITDVTKEGTGNKIPDKYLVAQNFPNPFNPSTVISYNIPQHLNNKKVKLSIHSITGELISTLVNTELPSGNYLTKWDGNNSTGQKVSSGIYFYNLIVGSETFIGKMNLVK